MMGQHLTDLSCSEFVACNAMTRLHDLGMEEERMNTHSHVVFCSQTASLQSSEQKGAMTYLEADWEFGACLLELRREHEAAREHGMRCQNKCCNMQK
jgi:hypothetical protein